MMTRTPLDNQASHQVKQVQYYDGLGRPSVLAEGGLDPGGKYIYSLQEYDGNGRVHVNYLPVIGSTSPVYMQKSDIVTASSQQYEDSHAYSTITYDAVGRPTFISTPGDEWSSASKGKAVSYVTNTAADNIKKYHPRSSTSSIVVSGGETYAPGSLTGEVTEDEDGHRMVTYKDMLGRVILQRRGTGNDTYFVYDGGGQLRFVLMPLYQTSATSSHSFEYRYDSRGRCVRKYLPNNVYTDYWYDSADRVMFLQDGYLRAASRYRFFLYDNLGRIVVQGNCSGGNTGGDITAAVAAFNAAAPGICGTGYTADAALALTDPQIEVVNYYDSYAFLSTQLFASTIGNENFSRTSPACALSLPTGSITMTTSGEALCTAFYYDNKGQVIDTRQTLLGGNYQKTLTEYNFTGQPTSVSTQLRKGSVNYTVAQGSTYNNNGQLLSKTLSTNGTTATTAEYLYDGLGRISTKSNLGGRLSTAYTYDLHGWLTAVHGSSASGNVFTEELAYADGATPCYNGNISEMSWKVGSLASSSYRYTYDALNRMTNAAYYQSGSAHPELYGESVCYDANGNITQLTRTGCTTTGTGRTDRLVYATYLGNQLKAIRDSVGNAALYDGGFEFRQVNGHKTTQYAYDTNGAMKYDLNRGIVKIDYDLLGNPRRVQFYNGNVIEYIYAADGTRLRTIHRTAVSGISVSTNNTHTLTAAETLAVDSTDYMGTFQFHGNSFSKYLFDDGYVTYTGSTPSLHFYLRDHLGSNRAVAKFSYLTQTSPTLAQITDYYPYGGVWGDRSTGASLQPYKYNGKELDRMHGLDWYDYGARQYDPAIARFTSMDPLAEKYYHISPYAYCAGNPVNCVDPDGMAWKVTTIGGSSPTGYEWIDESKSYDDKGNLLSGLYHQAIFFSENHNFVSGENVNMGSSTATVYLADGTITTFEACTYPSNLDKYPTIPEGVYEAKVGTHNGSLSSYTALKMFDIGKNLNNNTIDLGFKNPAYSDGREYAKGVNIHMSGYGNSTGTGKKGSVISEGCFLIERTRWKEFIGLFDNNLQKDNVISISTSRHLNHPCNMTITLDSPSFISPNIPNIQSRLPL